MLCNGDKTLANSANVHVQSMVGHAETSEPPHSASCITSEVLEACLVSPCFRSQIYNKVVTTSYVWWFINASN